MFQPRFTFVLSIKNGEINKWVVCYFHYLKNIPNDDSFDIELQNSHKK